ncbi:MAG: antibiotic biosynthesis monooxygenase [Nitrososphaeraceae archaeon]
MNELESLHKWKKYVGPVILINKFSVDPKEFDQFLKGYAIDNEKFKQQPGFISTQLYKGIGGSAPLLTMLFGNLPHTSREQLIML